MKKNNRQPLRQIKSLTTQTTPTVIHAPGFTHYKSKKDVYAYEKGNPLWPAILSVWRTSQLSPASTDIYDKLTIITWNNREQKGILEESLEKLELPYMVLGRRQKKWSNNLKFKLAHEVLGDIKTPFVLVVDCFDAILVREPSRALSIFQTWNCDMLFNGEMNFYPSLPEKGGKDKYITGEWANFQKNVAKSKWAYLNAGAYIARTPFFIEYITKGLKKDIWSLIKNGDLPEEIYPGHHQKTHESEQILSHWLFQDYYPRIQIDYYNKIFFNTTKVPFQSNFVNVGYLDVPLKHWGWLCLNSIKQTISNKINRLKKIRRSSI